VIYLFQKVRDHGGFVFTLLVSFTNPFDAFHLLGQDYWQG
jgi:hypothetical protein